jgi:hypothetical protein
MALVVEHSLTNNLDVVCECDRISVPTRFEDLASLGLNVDFPLKAFKLFQIFVLHSGVLNFYRIQFLFVRLRWAAEAGGELVGFMAVKIFAVDLICLFGLNNFVDWLFKTFVLHFGQFDLIF